MKSVATKKQTSKKSITPTSPAASLTPPGCETVALNARAHYALLGSTGADHKNLLHEGTAGDCIVHFLDAYGDCASLPIYAGLLSIANTVETCRIACGADDRAIDETLFESVARLRALAALYSKITDKAEEIYDADLAAAMQGRRVAS